MANHNLRWLALLTTVLAFAAVLTGAYGTSHKAVPGWVGSPLLHRAVSTLAGAGALAVAVGVREGRGWLLGTAFIGLVSGGMLEAKAPALAGVGHALAGSLLVSICAVVAVRQSAPWEGLPATVADEGTPSLRSLARFTWFALLVQTALGALYRHGVTGLMPHVMGAVLVMGLLMYAGIATLSTENIPTAVKRPALGLLICGGAQMLLGIGAYLYRLEFTEGGSGVVAMVSFTVSHVAVGAVATACCALMGTQILRYVRPAAELENTKVVAL